MDKLETIRITGNLIGLFYKDHHIYMTGQQLAELINKQSAELELADTTLQLVKLETIKQKELISQVQAKLDRILPELKVRLDLDEDKLASRTNYLKCRADEVVRGCITDDK